MAVRPTGDLTQSLRDLIEDSRFGQADADDLHNALLELERKLNIPLTHPSEWGATPAEDVDAYEAQERKAE